MPGIELLAADLAAHRDELIELNVEYLSWVFAGVEELFGTPADEPVGIPVKEYVPRVIDKVCGDPPPRGIFYLVKVDGELAGYESVCLDTALFMKSAHRLYEANGFSDCSAYEGVEVPSEFHGRWRFIERRL